MEGICKFHSCFYDYNNTLSTKPSISRWWFTKFYWYIWLTRRNHFTVSVLLLYWAIFIFPPNRMPSIISVCFLISLMTLVAKVRRLQLNPSLFTTLKTLLITWSNYWNLSFFLFDIFFPRKVLNCWHDSNRRPGLAFAIEKQNVSFLKAKNFENQNCLWLARTDRIWSCLYELFSLVLKKIKRDLES